MNRADSFKSMRQCGLLSRNVIRQIQSDIVTVEALSRLQASEIQSASQHQLEQSLEEKRAADEYYAEQLIDSSEQVKPARLSEEVREFNKQRNHFSKSTADESDLGVKDLECLLEERNGS